MVKQPEYPKETETQATVDPVPAEFDSAIAPQGYEPELVEEIADMETPAQKRRKAVRYLIWTAILFVGAIYMCRPSADELPNDIPIPYELASRPLPPADIFLRQVAPRELGDFTRVHQNVERSFQEPFVGAEIATATYLNSDGEAATISIINAGSYINANRYLTGLRDFLEEDAGAVPARRPCWPLQPDHPV